MPHYDYICTNGHVTEVRHGVHDPGPAKCERCDAEVRKLMSTPSIVFKGSGWAKKDRSSKPAPKAKSSTDHEAKPGATTDGKSNTSGSGSGSSSSDSSGSSSSDSSGSSSSDSSGSSSDG